jgi:membrane-bound lytic murein transglycosylase D
MPLMSLISVSPMPVSAWSRLLVACILALSAVALSAPPAHAQSRRDRAKIETLQRDLAGAEARYRAATGEPEASAAALTAMETTITACAKQRGCDVAAFLQVYRGALQAGTQEPQELDAGGGDDPIDFTADDVPPEATGDALLDERNRRFAEAVQFNPAVQAGIRRWLTDMRPSLMQSFENYQYLRPLMAPAFRQRGLPEALLFGILAKESNGKVHVGSRAGAVGPLQFMPATGRRFGLGLDGTGFDTRYDPQSSAHAAADYLMERYRALDNNIEMTLAAYNGGEGRAQRVYNAGGTNFWNYDTYNQFPAETRDYVPMVIAAAWLYLHPNDYGLRWPKVAYKPAMLKLKRPATIYELTICLGNTAYTDGFFRALRNLNPRLDTDTLLPAGGSIHATTQIVRLYNRYCAQGGRADRARQLVASDPSLAVVRVGDMTTVQSLPGADAPVGPDPEAKRIYVPGQGPVPATVATGMPAKPVGPTEHLVARGDTLVSIAAKYGCGTKELAQANGIQPPRYQIRPGQRLKLVGCSSR